MAKPWFIPSSGCFSGTWYGSPGVSQGVRGCLPYPRKCFKKNETHRLAPLVQHLVPLSIRIAAGFCSVCPLLLAVLAAVSCLAITNNITALPHVCPVNQWHGNTGYHVQCKNCESIQLLQKLPRRKAVIKFLASSFFSSLETIVLISGCLHEQHICGNFSELIWGRAMIASILESLPRTNTSQMTS